jgi:tRNA-2-methylthio-N6-dimethylallyladenosine synthase
MNQYDSELVRTLLDGDGVDWTSDPEKADVILVNTCCVRKHAEQRALGRLRQLVHLKKSRPWVRVGILGCIAQEREGDLFEEIPGLDWVVGPDEYRQLPNLISGCNTSKALLDIGSGESYHDVIPTSVTGPTAFIAIMRGCDNYCSYCIVPHVRGQERSRPQSSIIAEARALASNGVREITLLGQNVNSYRDGSSDFADILREVASVPGLERVRFTTSHPKDLSERLLQAMAEIPKVCPFLHLPVQSGSDRILGLMNRKYTRSVYLEKIAMVRDAIPDVAISTDILVGFPGETEQDFRDTMDLLETVRFHGVFSFRYSVRPGTAAAKLPDNVPEAVKISRLEAVIDRQREISSELHKARVGNTVGVLVESLAKKGEGFLMGRSPHDEVVVFAGNGSKIGEICKVKIEEVRGFTLVGALV